MIPALQTNYTPEQWQEKRGASQAQVQSSSTLETQDAINSDAGTMAS